MEFKFDAGQDFQIQAIEAVCDVFKGQPKRDIELQFGASYVSNMLELTNEALLDNVREVKSRNGINPDDALKYISGKIPSARGMTIYSFLNFSVEMETGTGKTYVYLRTIFELFKRYGMRKFIVVVPSVAIREGVIKTLKMTEKHFQELYSNTPYHYYVYDSANLTRVRQFALSNSIEIMVMTIAAFNKDANVIRQMTDRLQGATPINKVQSARPILILDEPQNMESENSIAALASLFPLFALRYSATHRNPYNLLYRLTPFEAYRKNLVKQIEVASILEKDDYNRPFIRVESIESIKNTVTAKLTVHKLMKTGVVKESIIKVKPGDSLSEKAGRPEYSGYEIDEINPGRNSIIFANGVEVTTGESTGANRDGIFEAQINYTIEEHMRKQARLRKYGIKVLSLFFIDRVDNYAPTDGIIRQIFTKSFERLKLKYQEYKDFKAEDVQSAYFAQSKKKGGQVIWEDSSSGASKKDEEAYNLIMKDKERLLSFEEPVSFIFSHSALREGWDNPNIFQICTLNQTASKIKKRQEIGRGVRLAVNQSGDRIFDEKINVLTVVANECYEKYVETLQKEYVEEYGVEGVPKKPRNAREKATAQLRKEYVLKDEFKELWERIKHKTRYAVKIDSEKLMTDVISELDRTNIKPPRITAEKAFVELGENDTFIPYLTGAERTAIEHNPDIPLDNIVGIMSHMLEHTTPPVCLTRQTLLEIYRRSSKRHDALHNPQGFAIAAVQIIKDRIADQLIDGIRYDKINEWYEMSQLDDIIEGVKDSLVPSERSVYDHVVFDSDIEKQFVEDLEKRDDVRLFVKLPRWFTVPTPIGTYNPDWAIVMDEKDEHGEATGKPLLYLVRETKGGKITDLRPDEKRKIHCGRKHFFDALGVDYQVVNKANDLPFSGFY
jgi:type III restriction enzyme